MKLAMTYIRKKGIGAVRNGGIIASLASMISFISSFLHLHFSFLIIPFSFILLLSCSSSSDSDEPQEPVDGPAVLNIYVYAPGQAVPTRANLGEVDATAAENAIHTLQIWVYTHDDVTPANDGKLVTYFKTTAFMASSEPDDFVDASPRPTVDVYVLANVTLLNCGLSFDENTERDDLEDAVLKYDSGTGTDFFGLTSPITEVPFEGLPMSGVLRNQPVTGSRPILTLGTSSEDMAKVKLARAVSRIRFVFSSSSNDFDGLQITKVTLNAEMIPNQEYFFLVAPQNPYDYKDNDLRIGNTYNAAESASLLSVEKTASCADPAYYAWDRFVNDAPEGKTQEEKAQDYETLISEAVATTYDGEEAPRITERRLYLRESDKLLSGKIYFKVKDKGDEDYGVEKYVTFSMVAPVEGDPTPHYFFSRNHTWTVYAYLSWAKMNIVAIHINKWETSNPADYTLYNW